MGKHDFTTFRASLCQAKSPVKTLTSLQIVRCEDDISVHARAPSFLHHQVRNMVGTLKLVGDGKWTKADVAAALAACDRTRGGAGARSLSDRGGLSRNNPLKVQQICRPALQHEAEAKIHEHDSRRARPGGLQRHMGAPSICWMSRAP